MGRTIADVRELLGEFGDGLTDTEVAQLRDDADAFAARIVPAYRASVRATRGEFVHAAPRGLYRRRIPHRSAQ
jgi:hypothetical protein